MLSSFSPYGPPAIELPVGVLHLEEKRAHAPLADFVVSYIELAAKRHCFLAV